MLESGGMRNETAPVVAAVGDALLHPEAMHLAAVTGRPVIDVREPAETARHIARAFAVLIDDILADLTHPVKLLPRLIRGCSESVRIQAWKVWSS